MNAQSGSGVLQASLPGISQAPAQHLSWSPRLSVIAHPKGQLQSLSKGSCFVEPTKPGFKDWDEASGTAPSPKPTFLLPLLAKHWSGSLSVVFAEAPDEETTAKK